MDLIIKGMAFGYTGYANATRSILKCLDNHNIKLISTNSYGKLEDYNKNLISLIKKDIRPKISIQVSVPFQLDRLSQYNIGYTMFEAADLPLDFKNNLNNCNELWVPSFQNKTMFERHYEKPVFHIPIAIDTLKFNPYIPSLNIVNDKRFKFFSLGTWCFRKGWHLSIPAFLQEFKKDEAVFIMAISYGNLGEVMHRIKEYQHKSKNPPQLIFVDLPIHENILPHLYKEVDVGLFPSMGEGYNLPALEMMATGKPIITTNASAMKDYCTEKNSFLIKTNPENYVQDMYGSITPHYKNMKFFQPDIDDIRKKMREAFNSKDLPDKGTHARDKALEYSYGKISFIINQRLEKINARPTTIK